MRIDTTETEGYLVVRFLDPLTVGSELEGLHEIVRSNVQKGKRKIAVRFHSDSFFSSRVLGSLVKSIEELRVVAGEFVILRPSHDLLYTLKAISVLDLVKIRDSLGDDSPVSTDRSPSA